jgi:hypothetical protein
MVKRKRTDNAMVKRKRTNNDLQNITQKTKDQATRLSSVYIRDCFQFGIRFLSAYIVMLLLKV